MKPSPNKFGINYSTDGKVELSRDKEWPHKTPKHLADAGMKICDECGALNPLEAHRCVECSQIIVMFVDRTK